MHTCGGKPISGNGCARLVRMGIKDWYEAQAERHSQSALYGVHKVAKGEYSYLPKGKFKQIRKPIAGAVAEFESGSNNSGATATRVITGAILAGPVGAVIGGLFKKQKGRVYVYVTFADGDVAILDGPVKDETKLREFAQKVNAAAIRPL